MLRNLDAGGALIALRAKSVKSAQIRLRTVLMGLILAGMAGFTLLPERWRSDWDAKLTTQGITEMTWLGCSILLVAAAGLAEAARRRVVSMGVE